MNVCRRLNTAAPISSAKKNNLRSAPSNVRGIQCSINRIHSALHTLLPNRTFCSTETKRNALAITGTART